MVELLGCWYDSFPVMAMFELVGQYSKRDACVVAIRTVPQTLRSTLADMGPMNICIHIFL